MVLLRLRAALETRANIVIDVPHDWTCAQLTSCLQESETIDRSDEIRLYECWRGCGTAKKHIADYYNANRFE